MNKLATGKQVAVLAALVEGNSIRSTARMTGVDKNTVMSLLVRAGQACKEYQDKVFKNLPCKVMQCDEIWSFCGMKDKNVPKWRRGERGVGDVWTWTAICADTKLIPHWYVGSRNAADATAFIKGLAPRLANRIQLTSDGHKAYVRAVAAAFGTDIDFSQLVKLYGSPLDAYGKYSPSECVGTMVEKVTGRPKEGLISTSYVERANLTMRMSMRRFTRLTNAFSKKLANHEAAIALHFFNYNFIRAHQTLKVTPAMKAGITKDFLTFDDIVNLLK